MAYIGQSIKNGTFSVLDTSGNTYNSSTTAFNLGTQVGSPAQLLVSKNGVIQKPGTDYTLATGGTQISFTTAPASGDSIFIVEISGAVGGPMNTDINGSEFILDVDADTSITADTDDRIDFKAGGTDTLHVGNGVVTLGTPTAFGPDGFPTGLKVKGDVLIGDFTNDSIASTLCFIKSRNTTVGSQTIVNNGDEVGSIDFRADDGDDTGYNNNVARIAVAIDAAPGTNDTAGNITFATTADGARTATERMRINSSGMVMIGDTTGDSITNNGVNITQVSQILVSRGGGDCGTFNRNTNDGQILNFAQAGSTEGNISVSGSTVSYNGFTGTHWSRLTDNSKPTILKGTILESLDEMCDWYQAVATIAEVKDDDGNVITPERKVKKSISLDGKNVGDSITFTHNNVEYTGTIAKENDVKHSKCKISDSSESKAIYGVFQAWDNDDDTVNDMYVAQVGTFVIRIHKDETVAKGDLIQSKGDGTGKVQADDIMRSSTVAKVLSTTKIETYSDGSYIVPCSLHC